MNNNLDPQILNIVKALAYTENGGQPDVENPKSGASGEEKSIFQFMPDTWKEYSTQASGKVLPLTPENEATVVYAKVASWLKQGKSPQQIFSMWNAGEQNPDAYKQNYKGTNREGIAYNTPKYVKTATKYLTQFEKESQNPPQMAQNTPTPQTPHPSGLLASSMNPQSPNPSTAMTPGLMPPPMKQARQV